jgi:hypothetical protein
MDVDEKLRSIPPFLPFHRLKTAKKFITHFSLKIFKITVEIGEKRYECELYNLGRFRNIPE